MEKDHQPQPQPHSQSHILPQPQPHTLAQPHPQSQSHILPQSQPQTLPQTQPQSLPQSQPQTQPHIQPQRTPNTSDDAILLEEETTGTSEEENTQETQSSPSNPTIIIPATVTAGSTGQANSIIQAKISASELHYSNHKEEEEEDPGVPPEPSQHHHQSHAVRGAKRGGRIMRSGAGRKASQKQQGDLRTTTKSLAGASGHPSVEKRTVPLIHRDELEIEGELGKGVFGKVFKGTLRDIVVAVKELKSKKIDNVDQFQAEISIMAHLRHPNIVLFMGASFDPPFIVTEYLEGGDLHDIIESYEDRLREKKASPPVNEILKLGIGIARGMSWLHKSIPPIIHKDLKPRNIMLDSHGNPKIIDFGLSEEQKTKEIENRKISGSASWMSPEMLKGEKYTEKIDIFAFGIIIWQLVAGSTLVYDTTKYESLPTQQALQAFITDITDNRMRPIIPAEIKSDEHELARLIEQCWEDDANIRPSFSYIVKALVRIYLSNSLREDGAIRLWKQYFGTKVKGIAPMDFYTAIWNTVSQVDPPDSNSPYNLYLKQRCLEGVTQTGNLKTVDIERFGQILHWFGPLAPTSHNRTNFFDRIETIIKNKWYHGELNSKEAENILLANNDKLRYDFLIRASSNHQYPFTMSRIEGTKLKKSIGHYRIGYNRSNGEYSMTFESKGGMRQEIRADSLVQFVKVARSTLGLKKPIPSTKYSHIFIQQITITPEANYTTPTEKKGLF